MPTIQALAVALTTTGIPRATASVDYDGTSDKTVRVVLVCPTWASADPAQNVTIQVQQSFDGEATWDAFATMVTQGARLSRSGAMPSMTCQCVDGRGVRKVRLVLSIDVGTLTAGVDLTF